MTDEMRCPECHVIVSIKGHWGLCSLETDIENVRRNANQIQILANRNALAHALQITKWKEQLTFWQGKFRIVKTENNALRRQREREINGKTTSCKH